ncbi:hypothetical protein [Arenibaculum pallidiluteum]|uniref:hypothetical protein n=1 Tax=Arenibaculum pallidiluteum TaxID=2812559 RepID=UPI001A970A57|nr:hypothetical protein [Arenibaculum pallidiluteum]
MTNKMPPVPPAGRSTKGPGDHTNPERPAVMGNDRSPPSNLAEQDRQGNVKQNTTHQGYQQDR